ncbi:MAG: T9SS type A sorting domain-containing protein [Flavobacteriia bacterium]
MNCFCSQDSTYIENLILDGYDDITRGLVNYAIYDDSCANVLDYVVKINLDGGAGLTNLQPNSWRLKGQDANSLYIESTQATRLDLMNAIGQVQKVITLQKGENQIFTNAFPSGIYFLKNEFGRTQKVLL